MRVADGGWLTPREAAMQLRRSYGQVLRLMEAGTLVSRRTETGRYFVLRSDVARLKLGDDRPAGEAVP